MTIIKDKLTIEMYFHFSWGYQSFGFMIERELGLTISINIGPLHFGMVVRGPKTIKEVNEMDEKMEAYFKE